MIFILAKPLSASHEHMYLAGGGDQNGQRLKKHN